MENLSKMKKNRILGAISIELVEKGNNQYVTHIKTGLNNAQIDMLTDIFYLGKDREAGKTIEIIVETLAKILYSYKQKLKGERVIFKDEDE